jgi:hypothetical protein
LALSFADVDLSGLVGSTAFKRLDGFGRIGPPTDLKTIIFGFGRGVSLN